MTIRTFRRAVAALSCAALMVGSALAMANESSGIDSDGVLPDLFIVRPVALVGTVLGTAVFLLALPFTVPTRTTGEAANVFVARPFEYTFNRPLGDFDHCGATRHACGDGVSGRTERTGAAVDQIGLARQEMDADASGVGE